MNSTQDWRTSFQTFLNGRGKIQQLAELTAVESMQATAEEQRKNQEAESSKVRKQLWDWEEPVKSDEEMRQTILGDVTHPAPIIMQSPAQQSSPLAAALAGFGIAAASGIGGYFLANQNNNTPVQPVAPIEFQDETISVGLGRIEDYLRSTNDN